MTERTVQIPNVATADPFYSEFIKKREAAWNRDPHAIAEVERLADQGSQASILFIAEATRTGTAYKKDLARAEGWYALLDEQGFPDGEYGLGRIHLENRAYERAAEAFGRGVGKNFAPAMHALATMHYDGLGVARDIDKAIELWSKAAVLGHFWAKRRLARVFLSGKLGPRKFFTGIRLFCSAIADGISIPRSDPNWDRLR